MTWPNHGWIAGYLECVNSVLRLLRIDEIEVVAMEDYLHVHPALRAALDRGEELLLPGFPFALRSLEISESNREELRACGIRFEGEFAGGNFVWFRPGVKLQVSISSFSRRVRGNAIIIDDMNESHRIAIKLRGSENLVAVAAGWMRATIELYDDLNLFLVGEGSSSGQALCILGGGKSICIGEDCMLAWNIIVRTSDLHALIDVNERRAINNPASIHLGNHVWIAHDVMIFKGTTIGSGSVVGAGSSVTRAIPPVSLAAGVPARILRSGVSWCRQSAPTNEHIDRVIHFLGVQVAQSGDSAN